MLDAHTKEIQSAISGLAAPTVELQVQLIAALRSFAANVLSDLVNAIEDGCEQVNLSSAIRPFVLDHYRSR